MRRAQTRRGQPVAALALMLATWIGARAMILEAGSVDPVPHPDRLASAVSDRSARPLAIRQAAPQAAWEWPEPASPPPLRPALPVVPMRQPDPAQARPLPPPDTAPLARPAFEPVAPRVASGHLVLWMAAVGQLPLPPFGAAAGAPMAAPFAPRTREPMAASPPRWSADGWLLLRRDGRVSLGGGPAGASYGASQTGAVVRYRLAPSSGHRPFAYLRATAAIDGSRERDLAAGFSARPLPRVPVTVAAELRATQGPAGTRLRPAAMAITELPPIDLPFDLRAEAYGQAGYVGGKGATAFVDGQVRVDAHVARLGPAELRAGGGVWGGAQKGAARLDIGPGATLGMAVTPDVSARLGLDWRFRVAGDAVPASGPALTLSAGF
ncbi:MAG TPA: hypothetical protein PKE25_06795 [Novosphingobium sp.]|nr:hypothetical protein [Novosphingobium sp.]